MKKNVTVLLIVLITILAKNSFAESDKILKGFYLTAYTAASKRFTTILDSAKAAGMNNVVIDVKNMNGDVFLAPSDKFKENNSYRPVYNLKNLVKEVKKRDMTLTSRIVMFFNQYKAARFPNLRPRSKTKEEWKEMKNGKVSWLDPSNMSVQRELLNLIEHVASRGVDEIQLDYIRFPTQGDMDDVVFNYQQEDVYISFVDSLYKKRKRRDIIHDFLKKAKGICTKYNADLTADVFAIVLWQHKKDIEHTGQDLPVITDQLDYLHPMIYSSHFSRNFYYREDAWNEPFYIMYTALKKAQRITKPNCKIIPYIQANTWRVNYKKEYIYAQLSAIESTNTEGFILWNSINRYMKTFRWIKEYYKKD